MRGLILDPRRARPSARTVSSVSAQRLNAHAGSAKSSRKVCPELVPPEKRKNGSWKDLIIVSENVGLRPSRQGGVRIEKDSLGTTGLLSWISVPRG